MILLPVFSEAYAGRCDAAVEDLLDNGVEGQRRDGVWTGPRAGWGFKHTRWRTDAHGFPVHVWIERAGGTVIDPTRWVFEGVWPYLYEGPADHYAEATLPLEPAE